MRYHTFKCEFGDNAVKGYSAATWGTSFHIHILIYKYICKGADVSLQWRKSQSCDLSTNLTSLVPTVLMTQLIFVLSFDSR